MCKRVSNNIGFTLVELTIVVPLIAIIFLVGYNMYFMINKSYKSVNDSFDISEELRIFQINIQKEANEAKKAEGAKEVLHKVSSNELYIYSDISNDNKPELIIYKLNDKKLYRFIKNPSNDKYPYAYDYVSTDYSKAKIVLNNIKNTGIFENVEVVREQKTGQEEKDNRRKVKINIDIASADDKSVSIKTYLVTKSRTEAE